MEDYKKKYEDALRKAKENKPLEEIFPELKESENERIRKSLIDVISEWSEDTGFGRYNVPRNEVIAWLEKQGKQIQNKWHKIEDGDLPEQKGDYLVACRDRSEEEKIFFYEMAYYTGSEWEKPSWDDVIAWCEISHYEE